MENKPIIGITMGDPAGIGPEIVVKAISQPALNKICIPLVFGDAEILEKAMDLSPKYLPLNVISEIKPEAFKKHSTNVFDLHSLKYSELKKGKPSPESGAATISYIEAATKAAIGGKIAAVVTGPINKSAVQSAGFKFPGHTEYFAHATNTRDFVMMLAGDNIRVSLVTIHEPLRKVPRMLTPGKILRTIELTDQALKKYFNIPNPRIAVAGLNPHAGEGSIFGTEEEDIIRPAIADARQKGIDVSGPLSADTVFHWHRAGRSDAVVAMYHDQGMIPIKTVAFDRAVNITLGIPIIRTSVDHGTAYDIAWEGHAAPDSMTAACNLAVEMVNSAEKAVAGAGV